MKWEYLVHSIDSKQSGTIPVALNRMGSQGWELVSVTLANSGSDPVFNFFLKRQVS
jgi:hypothetical protein